MKIFRDVAYNPDREIAVLRKLQPHPHILELHGLFASARGQAVVTAEMDFDLHVFLSRRQTGLSLPATTSFCGQLLRALAYMHHHRIVHRDLKPANVLLRVGGAEGEDSGTRLVVADFSRARVLPPRTRKRLQRKCAVDVERIPLSAQEGLTPGLSTPEYCAPEVGFTSSRRECRQGPSADIWSFGCIAFEMRTGHRFVEGKSSVEQLACAFCRLGRPATKLNLGIHAKLAEDIVPERQEFTPPITFFAATMGTCLYLIEASCRWCPESRANAAHLQLHLDQQQEEPTPAATRGEKPSPAVTRREDSALAASPRAALAATTPVAEVQKHFRTAFAPQVESTLRETGKTCDCKGHCYQPGHRYRGGCDSADVVVGGRHCLGCKCSVMRCLRPRMHGEFCTMHGRVWNGLPLSLQCARACREDWHDLIPCDILAFSEMWPLVKHHPLLAIVAALMKEPLALHTWRHTKLFDPCRHARSELTAESLQDSFLVVLGALNSCPNRAEVDQLARQGVARVMGPARTLAYLGVIRPAAEEDVAAFKLGKTLREYTLCANSLESLEQLLKVSAGLMPTWTRMQTSHDLLEAAECAQAVIVSLCSQCPGTIPCKGDAATYLRPHIVRKFALARLMHPEEAPISVEWSAVSLAQLSRMMPDSGQSIAAFPPNWSAQQVGEFIFDAPSAAPFVSMMACLWSEAVSGRDEDALAEVRSTQFGQALRSLTEALGTPPHPAVLMNAFQGSPAESKRRRT